MSKSDTVEFFKLHGCGNDFVFIDNREVAVPKEKMPIWAQSVCRRAFGVGADGLVFLDAPSTLGVDYTWHFYNADGSRAEMCGNAARCAGALAVDLGIAGYRHVLGSDAGPVEIVVAKDLQRATVAMTDPKDLALNSSLLVNGEAIVAHSVNTGVPHVVVFVEELEDYDVFAQGKSLRYHERYAPKGTNANFAVVTDPSRMLVRTYERGVEDETLACGTGVCAAVFIARQLGMADERVEVVTRGGDTLNISLKDGKVFMEGPVVKVFTGRLNMSSFYLS